MRKIVVEMAADSIQLPCAAQSLSADDIADSLKVDVYISCIVL